MTNFADFFSKMSTPDETKISEFVIEAEMYGGCRNTCPSFQVLNDGTYHYLYTPSAGSEKVVRKGDIPFDLQLRLREVVTREALWQQSVKKEPAVCNSYTDGIDVVYEITLDGTTYVLDSCGTSVDTGSPLWNTFRSIWSHFETGKK